MAASENGQSGTGRRAILPGMETNPPLEMPLAVTPDRCYRALSARDARFDGRFFVGVRSTGIYCRPVCPARTPQRKNVAFYECAAAAESAGYRPCRRCRPETAPGTPAWLGTSATVARALRLISEGALDEDRVEDLAERVGVGGRHLRRLFEKHVGASPLAVAQTRRVHFARRLLDETDLPVTEVALASGFLSVRRFNAAMRATFGRPPSELRRRGRTGRPGAGGDAPDVAVGALTLRLPYREPYDWDALLGYLAVRATPGVEAVSDRTYRRSFRARGRAGVVAVSPDPDGRPFAVVRVFGDVRRGLLDVVERVRRVFDLGADPARIAEVLAADPRLAPSVRRRPGLRVSGAWDPFELAVRAILGQQVSVKGATTLAGRLAAAYGEALPDEAAGSGSGAGAAPAAPAPSASSASPAPPGRLFPTAEALAEADIASIGMPDKRAEAIRELACRVLDGRVALSWGACPEEAHAALVAIPGVGEWTASYVAMRGLGQPDSFPAGDLGVRKALANGRGRLPTVRETMARSECWRPWRAYATLHLWASLTDEDE